MVKETVRLSPSVTGFAGRPTGRPEPCFFKHLKSNGFDLEELGFQCPQKIRLLVAIVAVLYVICVAEGLRQFHRIRAKKKRLYDPLKLREAIVGKGYSIVVNELVNIVHFVD